MSVVPTPAEIYEAPREASDASAWTQINFPIGPKAIARQILREAAGRHGLKIEAVTGSNRFKELVACRREIAWLIADKTELSYPQIAALLGKDHTTVIMAIRRQNEITGTNVRELGGIPEKTRERNRASALKHKSQNRDYWYRLKRSRLKTRRAEIFV